MSSNFPSPPAYVIFISYRMRYVRASYSYGYFILRAMRLANELLGQGYVSEHLKSPLKKLYILYWYLIKQYEIPLSRMLNGSMELYHIEWHPSPIRLLNKPWPYYRTWPLTKLRAVSKEHICVGFSMLTGEAHSSRHLAPFPLWLAFAILVETNTWSKLVVISWLCTSNIQRYYYLDFTLFL